MGFEESGIILVEE